MRALQTAVDLLSEWLTRALLEGRAALSSLRTSSTENSDLAEALRRACDDCRLQNSIDATFTMQGAARAIHPLVREEIYRIGYEAIQNACAHSGGTRVTVELEYGQNLLMSICDNGTGMDAETLQYGKVGHFGLKGMRERALRIDGNLTISSATAEGTQVSLLVPGKVAFEAV